MNNRDVECMELALIALFRPKYNKCGVITNYSFSDIDSIFTCKRWTPGYEKPILDNVWRQDFALNFN